MKANRWQEASRAFDMVEKESALYSSSRDLSIMSREGEKLPEKNPSTAGLFAALIPGLGHVYCNRYKDGMVAFLLNSLFIWAAVESFDQDHDVFGGILAALEVGWYSGNIYSAVNSAHKRNRKTRADYLQGLTDRLELHIFSTKKGDYGLALRVDF